MKSLEIIVIILAFISLFQAKSISSSNEKSKGVIVGESFNFEGRANLGAVTYGYAKTNGYSPENFSTMHFSPEMVDKLPTSIGMPKHGPLESVDEIPSNTRYYDGSVKLNKVNVNCKIYADARDCLNKSSCGWCGSTQGCVAGTNLGPLEPCVKSSFIYATPKNDWNPPTRIIKEDVSGMTLNIINN